MSNPEDVILWKIPIKSRVHVVEFEHGERTGDRVLRVDGNELFRTGQYKMTGNASFQVDTLQCRVMVKAADPTLLVCELKAILFNTQTTDKNTMDVTANGVLVPTTEEFLYDETVTSFTVGPKGTPCKIVAIGSGNIEVGIIHTLYVNNSRVPINPDYFDD